MRSLRSHLCAVHKPLFTLAGPTSAHKTNTLAEIMDDGLFYGSITQVLTGLKEIMVQMEALHGAFKVQASHRAHAVQVKQALRHGQEAARLIKDGIEPCLTCDKTK